VRTRRAAKNAHAAATGKAEHSFAVTGINCCRPHILFDEDFERPEITRKHEMPDENFEGTKEGHSDIGSLLRADGPDLPTSATA
jgi:hypothetical protein